MRNSRIFAWLILMVSFCSLALGQTDESFECTELVDPNASIPAQRGGRYFTEQGVVRALVVFVQFAGDNTNPNSTIWPPNQPPVYFHSVLDSTLTPQLADSGSLSHLFREMSMGKLQVYGDAYFVITDSTKQWYIDHHKDYGDVNKDVLQKLDATVDFSQYDNWTFGFYNHTHTPDGVVDMIIMVYREVFKGEIGLWNGVAALGFGGTLYVDNGATRIKGGYPGSGVTTDSGVQRRRSDWIAHEIGHLLLGSGHSAYAKEPYGNTNPAFWGLSIGTAFITNAYERHWLRWVDYVDLSFTDSLDISVSDYISTGDAYRIAIPGTNDEAFFIENHQRISYFDQFLNRATPNEPDAGLYIYHVKGTNAHPRFDLEGAEGRFNWNNPYWIANPWGSDSIPVFSRQAPNPKGYDGRDAIPTSKGNRFKIYATDNDNDGQWQQDWQVYGRIKDAFDVGYNQLFSPYSNPNSNRWDDVTETGISIEILNKYYNPLTGGYVYNLRLRMGHVEQGPPANPMLLKLENYSQGSNNGLKVTWAANRENDIAGYEVYRQRNGGSIDKISGNSLVTDTFYVDWGVTISPGSPIIYTYYVKAFDTQGKQSNLSNPLSSNVTHLRGGSSKQPVVSGNNSGIPTDFTLQANYPNPFNPVTHLEFGLPHAEWVTLKVYDLLGREVKTLVSERLDAGNYTVQWDGRDDLGRPAASGIYLYRLQAGERVLTRKMMLVR
ncbi:MAG: T9SS C-terminal target domain-containing protein [Chloroflexi bacterium]|nr:MAG: T9SS C-terminal target domain-containing protein [Chloroflexota bacterium]